MFSKPYERFLGRIATEPGSVASFVMFLLTLDGETVAAKLVMEGARHADWIIAGFSARLARHSPGNVLSQYCLRSALERGLDVEFAVGNELNKLFLSRDTFHRTVTYRVPLTRWGGASLRLRQIKSGGRAGRAWLIRKGQSLQLAFKRCVRLR